jgi:GT2 family glycosyltransferase
VQSVLYGNSAEDIVRAGAAVANSAYWAQDAGLVSEWSLQIGDCSPAPVLDDASLLQLRKAIEAKGGSLEYTVFSKNLGSALGQNTLATRSTADLMLILNPDTQVDSETVSVLAAALVDGVGIVEARQLPLEHPKDFEIGTGKTSWASTACALTSRTAFDELGGFDNTTFFLYVDDLDYSWRLRLAGYSVLFEPAARVFHDKRLSIAGDWQTSPAEVYYSAEAAILLAHKYSRPDLVASLISQFRSEGSEPVLKAVSEFESRRDEGRLPAPIDSDHRVAQFISGNYAKHRF